MSTFTGPQHPGAMREHRELRRLEAGDRREDFEREVGRVMAEQNITDREARPVAAASRRVRREVERRRSA